MRIIFVDGKEETFDRAEIGNCEIEQDFYQVKDEDEDTLAEINTQFIKMVKWD